VLGPARAAREHDVLTALTLPSDRSKSALRVNPLGLGCAHAIRALAMQHVSAQEEASTTRRLVACEDGAIIAFGVFFGVLLLGLLYYMVGLGATMYYRERMQDAADASAFAAAIVHARGMNTLALINVVMAALLAVLVALRLTEALIIVAQAILYALAWLGGATAAIASALEVVRQAVVRIEDAVSPVVTNVNKVLKVGGNVIRVATPLAANLSVLGKVAREYDPEVKAAVGIPPRLTLPVEDDKFEYLCNKAGVIAGGLALLPIKPIIPGGLRKSLQKALGKLAQTGSSWFCDGSDPPEYEMEDQVNEFPATAEMKRCSDAAETGGDVSLKDCREAEKLEGLGRPDEITGLCRDGQPVCQEVIDPEGFVDEDTEDGINETIPPGTRVEYSPHSWCGSEEGKNARVGDDADDCHRIELGDRSYPDPATEYGKRLVKARAECDPKFGDRFNYWWTERELDVTYQWNETVSEWIETGATESVPETPHGRPEPVDRVPCKDIQVEAYSDFYAGRIPVTMSAEWHARATLDKPVCTLDAPKPSGPTKPSDPTTIVLRRVEVPQVLGCSNEQKGEKVQPKALNLKDDKYTEGLDDLKASPDDVGGEYADVSMEGMEDLGDSGKSGKSGNEDTTPFRFIKGHLLGTSDMQIRSLAIGTKLGDSKLADDEVSEIADQDAAGSVHNEALRVIGVTRWGTGEGSNKLSKASEVWGRFSVAQAEYYFDDYGRGDALADWTKWDEKNEVDSGRDFLWAMRWTARMRRFRMSFKVDGESADGPPTKEESNVRDKLAVRLGLPQTTSKSADDVATEGPDLSCEGLGSVISACSQLQSTLTSLDGIFIH
jgi:hypothetical protein